MIKDNRLFSWLIASAGLLLMTGSALALIPTRFVVENSAPQQAPAEVSIVVSSAGCSPSNATKAAGQVSLKVVNQTGETDLTVRLHNDRGVLLREVNFAQGISEWSETFDLPSGSYTLTVVEHPQWTCQINIQ